MKKLGLFGLAPLAAIFAALPLMGAPAQAQQYPQQTIKVIVPYPAGGSTDLGARIIAENMAKKLGVTVLIDNRPGAGGLLGSGLAARAEPDGYTVLFTGNGIASAPNIPEATFDLEKDLIPVTRAVGAQFTIVANIDAPYKTIQEFVSYAEKNGDGVKVACPGARTAAHLTLEGFRQAAGLDFVAIQFAGNAPAATALLSGQPPVGIDAALTARGAIEAGQLRALAVTGECADAQRDRGARLFRWVLAGHACPGRDTIRYRRQAQQHRCRDRQGSGGCRETARGRV